VKALVIGGDSVVGRALSPALERRGHRVTPTTRRMPADGWLKLDLAAPLPTSLPECEVAFFCAAITGFAANRESPRLAERVNVSAPAQLARDLASRGAKVILLSTSAVLDCQVPHMRDDRPYAPRGAYGRHKVAAEQAFLALGSRASVLRLTKVVDQGDSRLHEWTAALRQGKAVRAFDDHRFSPLGKEHVVEALIAVAEKGDGGIYQVSGRDDWSYADLARELARRVGASAGLVQACSAASAGIPADEVTPYTSLDTSRLEALHGFAAPGGVEVLERALQ
jgi:dTDP-4-dehydrorhamnose reductase